MQRVAIAPDDLFGFRHFPFKDGIVRRQPVATIRCFDQEQRLSIFRVQAVDNILRQNDAERIAKFADLEFDHEESSNVIIIVITFRGFSKTAIAFTLVLYLGGYEFHLWIDMLNVRGVDRFWLSPVRRVMPGNRNGRLAVGSKAEMILLSGLHHARAQELAP